MPETQNGVQPTFRLPAAVPPLVSTPDTPTEESHHDPLLARRRARPVTLRAAPGRRDAGGAKSYDRLRPQPPAPRRRLPRPAPRPHEQPRPDLDPPRHLRGGACP